MASPSPAPGATWRRNRESSSSSAAATTVSCYLKPSRDRNKTRLTIFSSDDPSSPSSSLSSPFKSQRVCSRQVQTGKSLNNGRYNSAFPVIHDSDTDTVLGKLQSLIALIQDGDLSSNRKIRSIILLNITALVYASDIPVVKEVEAFMDPAAFCAVRFALSAIPFFPFVFRARNVTQIRNAGIELGLWVSLGYFVEALGLLTSDAGRASFISLFTVIVVPLLESMFGSVVPTRTWFGILMSVLGVAMLECSGSPPNVGDLLNFLSAIFFGIHMLRTEHISRITKEEDLLPLLGYEVSVVALLSTIWFAVGAWLDGSPGYENVSLAMMWDWMVVFPWLPALYTGLLSTGLCLWSEMSAMRDVSATEAAVIYGMEPLWGAGFAWFLLGERWGVAGWIGAALLLGGSLTVQIFGSPTEKSEDGNGREESNLLMVPAEEKLQKGLSVSSALVSSRNDSLDR